jgi:hypothetical protein
MSRGAWHVTVREGGLRDECTRIPVARRQRHHISRWTVAAVVVQQGVAIKVAKKDNNIEWLKDRPQMTRGPAQP